MTATLGSRRKPRVALLASGRGSTVRALTDAALAGQCDVDFIALVTDRPGAPVVALAQELGLEVVTLPLKKGDDRALWDRKMADALDALDCDVFVLAGFMRILGQSVVERFGGRMLNIHPSLLPAFPGKDAPAQAVAAGVPLSGCSVHLVDAGVDSGPVLGQAAVPVLRGDCAELLHARIQAAERVLYPAVVHAFAHGQLSADVRPLTLDSGVPALLATVSMGS
jgi:phosphoribosylglycinamide formyltransferase-1